MRTPAPRSPPRRIACSGASTRQRFIEFSGHSLKITLYSARAPDKHMVMIGNCAFGKGAAQKLTKAPFHPVAYNRIADFFGNGDAKAHPLAPIGPGQKHKASASIAQPLIGRNKISASGQNLWSRTGRVGRHVKSNNAYGPPLGARLANRPIAGNAFGQHAFGRRVWIKARIKACSLSPKPVYAESDLRPRLRRARITLRPPGVALRAKKPCRRARTRLLGWKVRFIVSSNICLAVAA